MGSLTLRFHPHGRQSGSVCGFGGCVYQSGIFMPSTYDYQPQFRNPCEWKMKDCEGTRFNTHRFDRLVLFPRNNELKKPFVVSPNGFNCNNYTFEPLARGLFILVFWLSLKKIKKSLVIRTSRYFRSVHLLRLIPNFFILDSKVVGFIPRTFAAPRFPLTRHSVESKISMIYFFSYSSRVTCF